MKNILALLILASVLFADVGPAPVAPDITVVFLKDGNGYAGNISLEYICDEKGQLASWGNTSAFSCTNGICRNDGWSFYKLSRCYYPKYGHFEYAINGETKRSGTVAFEKEGNYRVTIDATTGSVKETIYSSTLCPVSLIMLALPLLFITRKGAWN